MTEFTSGIFEASKKIYSNNKGSILRTIVYTIGHFAIAITVLMLVADVSFFYSPNRCYCRTISKFSLVFFIR